MSKPYTPDLIYDALAAAADWKRDLERLADSGRILLDTRDESLACEQVSRLWSLLLSRTRLDEATVQGIGQALFDLVREAVAWGRGQGIERVGAVDFRIEAERLDLGGARRIGLVFGSMVPPRQQFASLIALGGFESLRDDPSGRVFAVSRSLNPTGSQSPNPSRRRMSPLKAAGRVKVSGTTRPTATFSRREKEYSWKRFFRAIRRVSPIPQSLGRWSRSRSVVRHD